MGPGDVVWAGRVCEAFKLECQEALAVLLEGALVGDFLDFRRTHNRVGKLAATVRLRRADPAPSPAAQPPPRAGAGAARAAGPAASQEGGGPRAPSTALQPLAGHETVPKVYVRAWWIEEDGQEALVRPVVQDLLTRGRCSWRAADYRRLIGIQDPIPEEALLAYASTSCRISVPFYRTAKRLGMPMKGIAALQHFFVPRWRGDSA